jgi:molybdopterin molybdotransferase
MNNNTPTSDPSCQDDFDPNSLPVEIAIAQIKAQTQAIQVTQQIPTENSLGLVLAEPLRSDINVPPHNNSAMDGYAVRAQDIQPNAVNKLTIIGRCLAGETFTGEVIAKSAVRIMTGAPMPDGYDTVLLQEHIERQEEQIVFNTAEKLVSQGQNVRYAGEDIKQGDVILNKGRHITAADMGLIASIGIASVLTYRPITVAFFSTGDELQSISQPLEAGQIYDSNRYTLRGMLIRLGVRYWDMGVIADNPDSLRSAFIQASEKADVIISTGGVSVGEADFTKAILTELGSVNFWKIAMKPGRPLAFGKVNGKLFFGLPGNPVSVMVTFYQFVQQALRECMGETEATPPLMLQAKAQQKLRKRPGRVEYQRGILSTNKTGELIVSGTGDQGSGILTTMSRANCFVILAMQTTTVEAGEMVTVQPFSGLI